MPFTVCFLPYNNSKELHCIVDKSYDSRENAFKVFNEILFFIIPKNFLSVPRLLRGFIINKYCNDHMLFLFIIVNAMINFFKYKLILYSLKEHNFMRYFF